MSTSASLASLLQKKADLNYYTQQQIWYANKQEASSAKVAKYAKYEEQWEKAYDDCINADTDKPKKLNGRTYNPGSEAEAEAYAYAKVKQRDEEFYLEICDEDMEYDSMKEMYNTMCEELRAEVDSMKQLVSTNAQDTHLLGS